MFFCHRYRREHTGTAIISMQPDRLLSSNLSLGTSPAWTIWLRRRRRCTAAVRWRSEAPGWWGSSRASFSTASPSTCRQQTDRGKHEQDGFVWLSAGTRQYVCWRKPSATHTANIQTWTGVQTKPAQTPRWSVYTFILVTLYSKAPLLSVSRTYRAQC